MEPRAAGGLSGQDILGGPKKVATHFNMILWKMYGSYNYDITHPSQYGNLTSLLEISDQKTK